MRPAPRPLSLAAASGLALLFVAAGACFSGGAGVGATTSSSSSSSGSGGTTSPPECPTGTPCDGSCADTETDVLNCGACGRTCVVPHGASRCSAGACAVGECEAGFADCDGDPETGCELAIDCEEGGACMTACGSAGGLACGDACAPVCVAPAESCDALDDDCNGQCDEGALAGCRVAVHRAYNGTSGHLFTTDLAEAMAWGLEAANFFYLYSDAAADLRPFFRCAKAGSGNYLYSESNDCELTGAPLLTVGFIAPIPAMGEPPTCGAIPLYRIQNAGNKWHFYTLSLAERDAALGAGWVDQGVAGYVWTAP